VVVLDTSALIYWTMAPNKLSTAAERAIRESQGITISAISIWEIGLKAKRGRLVLPFPISEFAELLQKTDGLEIVAVDVPTWLENLSLNWDHRDPANRTIVATATLLDCPLITSDREIRSFYKNCIW